MPYGLKRIVEPEETPVSVEEQKAQSRISLDVEDDYLAARIAAAATYFEDMTGRQLVQAVWKLTLDCFPDVIRPPRSPLLTSYTDSDDEEHSIVIQYVDTDGELQTLAADQYEVDDQCEPGRIVPAYGTSWPATRDTINAVRVTFPAGYGEAADVPEGIKGYILALVGHWYKTRELEVTTIGGNVYVPQSFQDLLQQYTVMTYG